MKRREFLKNSLAVGVAASFTGVAFLESATSEVGSEPAPGMLNAQMIWCAESVPVPLKTNGPASGIASSSDSHAKIATPDLHAVFAREFTLDALPTEAVVRLFAYTRTGSTSMACIADEGRAASRTRGRSTTPGTCVTRSGRDAT